MIENTRNITKLHPPKYKDIVKKFEEEYLVSELELKKKKLAEIREMHKPIDRDEIEKHARFVDRKLKEIQMSKERERIDMKQKLH